MQRIAPRLVMRRHRAYVPRPSVRPDGGGGRAQLARHEHDEVVQGHHADGFPLRIDDRHPSDAGRADRTDRVVDLLVAAHDGQAPAHDVPHGGRRGIAALDDGAQDDVPIRDDPDWPIVVHDQDRIPRGDRAS